jgi:hypothetical protein
MIALSEQVVPAGHWGRGCEAGTGSLEEERP